MASSADGIQTDRLAVDLFRHLTFMFRMRPQPIPQTTLDENVYTSDYYIKDIARPVIFYEILVRDCMKQRFEKLPAESMSDTRDRLAIITNTLMNRSIQKMKLDIYKQVLMSIATCMEMIQYLSALGRRELLKDMPHIWAEIFESQMIEEFQLAGGFDEYISYWNFLKTTDAATFKFMKLCSMYCEPVSTQFKTIIGQDFFRKPEVQRKILCHKGDILVDESVVDILLTSIMELEPMPIVLSHAIVKDADSEQGEGSSASKRPKKLKAKPGQSYSSFQAERRAQKQGDCKNQPDIEDIIKHVEELECSKP